ncbi:MAG TPA: hypothetical protein VL463_06150 [Kofleriaceae bacterium]|nr:hypothetical protein [Kofleriaceae bacterium]
MTRVISVLAFLACACASGHNSSSNADSSTVDSSGSNTPDSPQQGSADAPDHIDAPPGTPDAKVPDAAPDANNCSVQPCTLAPQCGCPANQSCDIDPTDLMGNLCRAINTPGKETSTCGSFSECDKGYVCLNDGACHRYCATSGDCISPRGQCVIQLQNGGVDIDGAIVCSSNCDPIGNASTYCPANDKCGIFTATFKGTTYDITDCEAQGAGGQGTNCKVGTSGDDTKCAANYSCTTLDGTNFACRKYCTFQSGQCSTSCLHFNPALTIGGTEYGVCQ